MSRPKLILLGKLPPPYIGPAIATEILLNSSLSREFAITHFDTTLNDNIDRMGRFGWQKIWRSFTGSRQLFGVAKELAADMALVPISQTAIGFIKDSLYIMALKKAGVSVVVQLRGSDFKRWFDSTNWILRRWVRFVLRKTEGVIVLGERLRWLFEEFFAEDRIYVAPNGADFPALSGTPRKFEGRIQLVYLSNFLPGKGFDLLLQALALRPSLIPLIEINAYGAWDDKRFHQHCESIIEKHSLTNVHIHPPVSGIRKWNALNSAHLFVFTPRHPEGHPWAIVEAMAAGLPVISTDRGAITESVIDGDNGFIIPLNDANALADKLALFCERPEMLEEMGHNSRKLYLQKFTGEKMGEQYVSIFQKVLKKCAG